MSEGGKRKRRSRKSKEEKMLEKINKEEAEKAEQEEQEKNQPPPQPTAEEYKVIQKTMERPDINQKMLDMDVRIKYGFLRTLHNNLISINKRFNWDPDEILAIGMIFRDFQSIELNVYNTVMENEENPIEEEEEEEEEEENNEEEIEDIN